MFSYAYVRGFFLFTFWWDSPTTSHVVDKMILITTLLHWYLYLQEFLDWSSNGRQLCEPKILIYLVVIAKC